MNKLASDVIVMHWGLNTHPFFMAHEVTSEGTKGSSVGLVLCPWSYCCWLSGVTEGTIGESWHADEPKA